MRVTGVVLIPAGTPTFPSATLHVRLLDVTLADAPSVVLAEQAVRDLRRLSPREQSVPFTLNASLPDHWHGSLQVSAHADLAGDGQVHNGDLLSTTSYPVSPAGTDDMVVAVHLVGGGTAES